MNSFINICATKLLFSKNHKILNKYCNNIAIIFISGSCIDTACDSEIEPLAQSRSLANDVYSSQDEGILMASTSVFVLDPGDAPRKLTNATVSKG